MMRTISMILSLLLAGTLLWADEEWIQVVYAKDEKTVAADFLQRIKDSGYPYRIIKKDGSLKIWVGSFDDMKKAQAALPLVRCRITPDAFIVSKEKESPVGIGVYIPMESVAEPEKEVVKPMKKEVVAVKEEKAPEKEVEKLMPPPCTCDKRALHMAHIAKAIAFYRDSPYHRFLMPEM